MSIELFDPLFMEGDGRSIIWKGDTLYMVDRVSLLHSIRLRFSILHVESPNQQGVVFEIYPKKGNLLVGGKKYKSSIVFWFEDVQFEQIEIEVKATAADLFISNCWSEPNCSFQRWTKNHAMRIEEKSDGSRIYYCNDGDIDTDFNDIVFKVEFL